MQKHHVVARAEQIMEPLLTDLQAIVNIDSGTYNKGGVDNVGAYLQERFQGAGFTTHFERQVEYGDHLVAVQQGREKDGARILLIGHIDTVFPDGEVLRRPFSRLQQDGRNIAKGPGVLDMKSGVLMGFYGTQLLQEAGEDNYQSLTFVCNSDEEIGSPSSKALIIDLARQADAVIVLEPGRKINTVVSARKGIGHYRIDVHGLAAHAGVEPQNGRNAILELSHQVVALQAINGTIPGVTLNVGIIHGGGRTNIVPDYAYCEIDVRISDREGAQAVEAALHRVTAKTTVDGTKVILSGAIRSMPFERTERSGRLVQLVKAAGQELGLQIEDVGSGGGSDANSTASIGVPTIDGLGAGGGLAHNPDEYIELDYLPLRIALVTEVVRRIGKYYQSGQRL